MVVWWWSNGGLVVVQWWSNGGLVVVRWWSGGGLVVVWWWSGPMVVQWWSNGGLVVVQWWSNGGLVVVQWWSNGGPTMTCAADSTWFVLVRSVTHHVYPFVMCKLRVVMFLLMRNIINVCDVVCAPQSQVCNRSLDMTCAAGLTCFVCVRSVAQSIGLSCANVFVDEKRYKFMLC
jgi:hypothetical protein